LPFLAHCRAISSAHEDQVLMSALISNRLPVASSGPTRYYAHLVSLEGFALYLGPNATSIPTKPNSQELMDVQLCSLYNWSFLSMPETLLSFKQLVAGLIASEGATAGTLALPVPQPNQLPAAAVERLKDGYAPLQFISGSGDETLAWYRGPFSPVVPQPLPPVGNPPGPVAQATTADELMIYLARQGLFDLSYAAAWNIGRNLALADSHFAQTINGYISAAKNSAATLAQRMAMSHFSQVRDPRVLLARDATRKHFAHLMGAGLGRQWTEALAGARRGDLPQPSILRPRPMLVRKNLGHARRLAPRAELTAAIEEQLAESTGTVAQWLANLALFYPVPFSHLVPDPRMLPVESIRFFYVDQGWIDALIAGATSIGIHNSADAVMVTSLHPALRRAANQKMLESFVRKHRNAVMAGNGASNSVRMTGVLIRSQLVTGWPALVISATSGGVPLNIVRDDSPSPSVRLCLFDGIPDTVNLAEPYQGLQFGVEENGIVPRTILGAGLTGTQLLNVAPVPPSGYQGFLSTYCRSASGGVIQVAALAQALQTAVGATPFDSGSVVNWNGSPLATTFLNSEQLSAVVPANLIAQPGTAQITVTTAGATSTPTPFNIGPASTLVAINPQAVRAGSSGLTLTLHGIGFASNTVVNWNGSALATEFVSSSQLTATVAASLLANPGAASVTMASGGLTSNALPFTISGPVMIRSLSPAVAMAGGEAVTLVVDGAGFANGAVVNWNGSPLQTTFQDSEQVQAVALANLLTSAATASVTVSSGGNMSNSVSFVVVGSQPVISLLNPPTAPAGGTQFTLTINGGFGAGDFAIQMVRAPELQHFPSA
jgi:hypothetical protein